MTGIWITCARPRSVVPESIMPAYSHLEERR